MSIENTVPAVTETVTETAVGTVAKNVIQTTLERGATAIGNNPVGYAVGGAALVVGILGGVWGYKKHKATKAKTLAEQMAAQMGDTVKVVQPLRSASK